MIIYIFSKGRWSYHFGLKLLLLDSISNLLFVIELKIIYIKYVLLLPNEFSDSSP